MRTEMICVLTVFLTACSGAASTEGAPPAAPVNDPIATPPAPAGTAAPSLEKAPDSGKVDRIGAADGSLKPDGVNDLSFVAEVDGPVAAIYLVSVDEKGTPNGQYQADTLVGQAETPKELGAKPGSGTSGLGVAEGERLLNAADGSLPEVGPGKHKLTLYVATSSALQSGARLRLYVQRPDKTLLAGATVTN
jgi:hypothetical protein